MMHRNILTDIQEEQDTSILRDQIDRQQRDLDRLVEQNLRLRGGLDDIKH
jgi:hypothetical protein